MKKYGKVLLAKLPDETTRLLQDLCTAWVPRGQQPSSGMEWDYLSWNAGMCCVVFMQKR